VISVPFSFQYTHPKDTLLQFYIGTTNSGKLNQVIIINILVWMLTNQGLFLELEINKKFQNV